MDTNADANETEPELQPTNATVDVTPVLKPLETIASRGFDRHSVFTDWIELMIAALQRDDDEYLDVLANYDRDAERDRDRGSRVADLFSEAFGELLSAMDESNQDVLGAAYETFGMQNKAFGQHFTPDNIAAAMAELTMAGDETEPEPPVTIADPACGSGRMLIHAARRHDVPTLCFGQDKSELCAMMCALNFCFFNMDGMVVVGDTLKLEKRRAWITRNSPIGGDIEEVDPDEVPWPEAAFEEAEKEVDPDVDDVEPTPTVTADGSGIGQSDLDEWGF